MSMPENRGSRSAILPVLAVLAAMIFWGLSFVSSKAVLNTGFPPMTMVFLRFLIASMVLLPLQRRLHPDFRIRKKDRLFLLLSAMFGVLLYFLCESRGIKFTSASNAALITAVIPALTVGAEYLFYRNSIRWYQGLGIALSILGVYFVVQRSPGQYDRPLLGNLLMFGACFSWVAYNMFSRNLHEGLRGVNLTAFQSIIGVLLLLPVALSEYRSWEFSSLTVWLNLLYLGLVCTALSFFLYLFALSRLGPVRVTSFINLIPVVSVVGGMLILSEQLLPAQAIGGLSIIFGVFLVNVRRRRRCMEFYESISPYCDYIFPADAGTVSFLDGRVKPGSRILDIACGTGSYSLALAEGGHRVTGIDLDRAMIEAAGKKSREQGLEASLTFAVMDMLDIERELEPGFDLVFCIGNSLVHLESEGRIARVLEACHTLLASGGTLVVQIINYDRIIEQGIASLPTLRDEARGLEFERRYEYDPSGMVVSFRTILRVEEAGKRRTISNRVPLWMLRSSVLIRLTEQAGFGGPRLYGGFDQKPFSLDALPLVLCAGKS